MVFSWVWVSPVVIPNSGDLEISAVGKSTCFARRCQLSSIQVGKPAWRFRKTAFAGSRRQVANGPVAAEHHAIPSETGDHALDRRPQCLGGPVRQIGVDHDA